MLRLNNNQKKIILPKFVEEKANEEKHEESPIQNALSFSSSSSSSSCSSSSFSTNSSYQSNTTQNNNNNNNNLIIQKLKSNNSKKDYFDTQLESNLDSKAKSYANNSRFISNTTQVDYMPANFSRFHFIKKYEKKTLTRSQTENLIKSPPSFEIKKTSIEYSSNSSPFSSILSPFNKKINPISENDESNPIFDNTTSKNEADQEENIKINSVSSKLSNGLKKRYTIDFLLIRSDTANSKKMPCNWKILNEKFPEVCFCGKVNFLARLTKKNYFNSPIQILKQFI
jgi:hypothetical protein